MLQPTRICGFDIRLHIFLFTLDRNHGHGHHNQDRPNDLHSRQHLSEDENGQNDRRHRKYILKGRHDCRREMSDGKHVSELTDDDTNDQSQS